MNPKSATIDFSEFVQQPFELWKKAILKGKDPNDASLLQWTSLEGLEIAFLPEPEKVAKLEHLTNFHHFWVNQKPFPGWKLIQEVNKDFALPTENNLADVLLMQNETKAQSLDLNAEKWISNKRGNADSIPVWDFFTQQAFHNQPFTVLDFENFISDTGKISIDGTSWHNAGAGPVLETAISLSILNAYLKLSSSKAIAQKFLDGLLLNSANGTTFFLEIAKLRSLRFLAWNLISTYGFETNYLPVWAATSSYQASPIDLNTNLLRNTVASMAGVCGGADFISILPHNGLHEDADATRLAQNIAHLLMQEAHFDKVTDSYAGSYFVENLTDLIAQKVWTLFMDLEEKGGFQAVLNSGHLQNLVQESSKKQKEAFNEGKTVVVGVNKYAETASEIPEVNPFLKKNSGKISYDSLFTAL